MAGGEVKVEDEEMMVQGDLVPAVGADQVSPILTLCLCLELGLSFGSFVLLYPWSTSQTQSQALKKAAEDLLPVSLLCGFLGAGKTTLLKHILETKHSEENFKCAVIVNDMAALNIDKSLIDQSALVQSDEVNFVCTTNKNI